LTLEELLEVSRNRAGVALDPVAEKKINESHKRLQKILHSGKPVYGINTGFGIFADQRIPEEESSKLSRNIILSHAVGTGPILPDEVVRAAMLVRANTLARVFGGSVGGCHNPIEYAERRSHTPGTQPGVIGFFWRFESSFTYGVGDDN